MEEFDYIVVGGGSAGAVVAGRLSERRDVTVLLLEAGPRTHDPRVHIPAAFSELFSSKLDWGYRTVAQPALSGRSVLLPQGRLLGGSSAINAMMWIRGMADDYEAWSRVAGPEWRYSEVVPFFRRAEATEGVAAGDSARGTAGPVPVRNQRDPNPLTKAWLAAAGEVGIATNDRRNGGDEGGVGLAMVTQRRGRRVTSADAYLTPARFRRRLVVRTGAVAERIVFDGRRATGVVYRNGSSATEVHARQEVIVCAGAVNSPALLWRSGIGPERLLRSLGVDVVSDRREVGRNLQDHLTAGIAFAALRPLTLAGARSVGSVVRYLGARRGLLTSNVAEGYGFIRSRPGLEHCDLELLFLPVPFLDEGLTPPASHGVTLAAVLLQPESRGEVTLTSSDPSVPPRVDPRYLTDPAGHDEARLSAGIRVCLEIARAPALKRELGGLIRPTDGDDEQLVAAAVHDLAQTLYHPVGTARMGLDAASVVDPHLRVRGVERLRVVDASVIPTIIRGHTHAPVVMLAERAAQWVRDGDG